MIIINDLYIYDDHILNTYTGEITCDTENEEATIENTAEEEKANAGTTGLKITATAEEESDSELVQNAIIKIVSYLYTII